VRKLDRKKPVPGEDIELTIDLMAQQKAASLLEGKRGAIVVMDVSNGDVASALLFAILRSEPLELGPEGFRVEGLDRRLDLSHDEQGYRRVVCAGLHLQDRCGGRRVIRRSNIAQYDILLSRISGGGQQDVSLRKAAWYRKHCGRLEGFLQCVFLPSGVKAGNRHVVQVGIPAWIRQDYGDFPPRRICREPGRAQVEKGCLGRIVVSWRYCQLRHRPRIVQATPMQIARAYAAVANGGFLPMPRLSKGEPILGERIPVNEKVLSVVRQGLEQVVKSCTGRAAGAYGVKVAGKTGTAQTSRYKNDALFVGYAPADSPKYVAVVLLEEGESGGKRVAPLAAEMLAFLLKEKGE